MINLLEKVYNYYDILTKTRSIPSMFLRIKEDINVLSYRKISHVPRRLFIEHKQLLRCEGEINFKR